MLHYEEFHDVYTSVPIVRTVISTCRWVGDTGHVTRIEENNINPKSWWENPLKGGNLKNE
jgi:hypothetical protein